MRAAIDAELEAKDNHEAAEKAVQISQSALAAVRDTLARAEAVVATAVDEVIRSEAYEPLRAAIEKMVVELIQLRVGARFLFSNDLFPGKASASAMKSLLCADLVGPPGGVDYQAVNEHPAYLRWTAARESLRQDADAALPSVESLTADTAALIAAANYQADRPYAWRTEPPVSSAIAARVAGVIGQAAE